MKILKTLDVKIKKSAQYSLLTLCLETNYLLRILFFRARESLRRKNANADSWRGSGMFFIS